MAPTVDRMVIDLTSDTDEEPATHQTKRKYPATRQTASPQAKRFQVDAGNNQLRTAEKIGILTSRDFPILSATQSQNALSNVQSYRVRVNGISGTQTPVLSTSAPRHPLQSASRQATSISNELSTIPPALRKTEAAKEGRISFQDILAEARAEKEDSALPNPPSEPDWKAKAEHHFEAEQKSQAEALLSSFGATASKAGPAPNPIRKRPLAGTFPSSSSATGIPVQANGFPKTSSSTSTPAKSQRHDAANKSIVLQTISLLSSSTGQSSLVQSSDSEATISDPNVEALKPSQKPISRVCSGCGTAKKNQKWRTGPRGPKTLCHACGLHYAQLKLKHSEAYATKVILSQVKTSNSAAVAPILAQSSSGVQRISPVQPVLVQPAAEDSTGASPDPNSKKVERETTSHFCSLCNVKQSPKGSSDRGSLPWRGGPKGPQTLCRPCGKRFDSLKAKMSLSQASRLLFEKYGTHRDSIAAIIAPVQSATSTTGRSDRPPVIPDQSPLAITSIECVLCCRDSAEDAQMLTCKHIYCIQCIEMIEESAKAAGEPHGFCSQCDTAIVGYKRLLQDQDHAASMAVSSKVQGLPGVTVQAPQTASQAITRPNLHILKDAARASSTQVTSRIRSRLQPPPTPRFDQSTLDIGSTWSTSYTPAELILVIWLRDVRQWGWTEIETAMGRGVNTCCTKYNKELKSIPNDDPELNIGKNLAALRKLLTLDLPIQETHDALVRFIDSGHLPWGLTVENTEDNLNDQSSQELGASSEQAEYGDETEITSDLPKEKSGRRSQLSRPTTVTQEDPFAYSVTPKSQSEVARSITIRKHPKPSRQTYTKPYLNLQERRSIPSLFSSIDWRVPTGVHLHGVLQHLNFSREEQEGLIGVIQRQFPDRDLPVSISTSAAIKLLLPNATATTARLSHISLEASDVLPSRTRRSIESFIRDCVDVTIEGASSSIGLQSSSESLLPRVPSRMPSLQRSLLDRALHTRPSNIKRQVFNSMGPSITFSGTSGDVGTLAFSPGGNIFAAGSTCITDQSSMQYNRNCNLMVGNIERRTITELADHWRQRVKPTGGVNSTEVMHATQDSRLFETVSAVDFSPLGDYLYSAGYDSSIQSYRIGDKGYRPILSGAASSKSRIDLLRTSKSHGLIATGSQSVCSSIEVWKHDGQVLCSRRVFSLSDAIKAPEKNIHPSCLQWGNSAVPNYLLAGFSSNLGGRDRWGKLCLWDVNAEKEVSPALSSGPYSDATWSPNGRLIGGAFTGRPPSVSHNPGAQSYIRVFNRVDGRKVNEADCRAIDINDVTFCPYNDNIIAAGATNGKVYVWDRRNFTANCLHVLEHGDPLAELPVGSRREVEDTGVRFCSWNESQTGLVTGSSDGVVKVWDIFRATNDAHTRDLVSLRSAVMSGAYSSDFSRLVVGEAKGSVTVLEIGMRGQTMRNTPDFKLIRAESAGSPPNPESNGKQVVGWTCPIKLCHELEALSITKESEGDSGRWKDRIPEALMASLSISSHKPKPQMISGRLECSHCNAPARPRLRDVEQEEFPLCERCGFSCFRCGRRIKIGLALETIACCDCKLEWRIGALGYDLIKKPEEIPDTAMQDASNESVPALDSLSAEQRMNRVFGEP